MVFAHDARDGVLVLLSLLTIAAYVTLALVWEMLPLPGALACGVAMIFLICTNYQCVAHNFLHNPFFVSRRLNTLFALVNSIPLGMSQTLYTFHHFNHHRFSNDYRDPETGRTRDRSSTFAHSRAPQTEEPLASYALVGVPRTDLVSPYREAKAKNRHRHVLLEAAAVLAFVGVMAWINWQYVLVFVFPVWFFGQAAALAENYFEHHKARPGHARANSVSCYNPLYNLIWFNNGYHQEHHCRPAVHWTEIPAVRSEMLPDDQRRVVRGAHWFNF
jgi:fatty acid desaturase